MEQIYLDHAATTPIDQQVLEAMYAVSSEVFGNPSSIHAYGRKARAQLDHARRTIAGSIHAIDKEIIFTSGGTEADNLAIIGTARANISKGKHIITTQIEHHAVLHPVAYLETEGFEVTYLPVNTAGLIDINDLKAALRADTILVSIMFVNNETGAIQPIGEIGALLQGHQAYFHTDAVQAFGLIEIDVQQMGIDLLTVSAHKINGPKGIGFLYVSKDVALQPLQLGGDQERKRRGGTESVINAVGFNKAVQITESNRQVKNETYTTLKSEFLRVLTENNVNYEINGIDVSTVPSIVNIYFPEKNVEALLTNFDLAGIAASSGSACTAGSSEPSHVLIAMFDNNEKALQSVRFSFGLGNTTENVIEAAERISKIMNSIV